MSNDDTVVGVDACPAGWVATVITPDGANTETYGEFADLRNAHDHAKHILVDIPIGLPEAERRRCDQHARDLLGSRRSSVFWPPCEAAANADDYEEANQAHKDTVGHGLSQQAFYIREKIVEVGAVVGDKYDGQVKESHPELCFAALNDQPIAYAKSSQQGRAL
ncbi:DUF429 domain-containing protein [Haloarcula halophila]|uniref:DUF429 domain-containing protein n=1 Tax=Haloarcula TaxID=2237 RepID=UPI0023E39842|nr:DUF429 domain-containing protein [Halomicroarcula sp. DFY41]